MELSTLSNNEWRCENCRAILGYFDGEDILRIKYKDLYFFVFSITGTTQVKSLCRKCGKINSIFVKSGKSQPSSSIVELEKYL